MRNLSSAILCALGLAGLWQAPALAQATRTWVSGVGDDANPCSRTAPCKTFAGAISKTAAGGEINCLDPGGFGAVTITKSIAIVCDNTEAGILVSGTNGVVVNAGATGIVTLKGLDFEGLGTGINGINVLSAGAVHVHKVQIRGFRGAGGSGINFAPSTGAPELYVADSYITDNGSSATTGGITIRPTATGSANVSINRVQLENNSSGITADGSASTGVAVNFALRDSVVAGNTNNGVTGTTTASHAAISGMIYNTAVSANAGVGINANGVAASGLGSAVIRVGSSVIAQNVSGVTQTGSGQVRSYTTNQVNGNLNSETFTLFDPLK
jgi:hypothetical protein